MIANSIKKELYNFIVERLNNLNYEELSNLHSYIYDYYDNEYIVDVHLGQEWYDNGCTKLVLSFEEYPSFVFKIPFTNATCYDEEYDSYDTQYYCNAGATEHYPNHNHENWDYCGVERDIYHEAERFGVEELFCETDIIGCYRFGDDYLNIYVSEKADEIDCNIYNNIIEVSDDDLYEGSLLSEMCNEYLSDDFCANLIACYGKERAVEMINFIKKVGINDIHGANYGWLNNKLKIVDYSGYHE